MKIRVVRAFNAYKKGMEFDFPDGMARILAARGLVEEVREEVVEQATAEQRSETTSVQWKPRKKRYQQ